MRKIINEMLKTQLEIKGARKFIYFLEDKNIVIYIS